MKRKTQPQDTYSNPPELIYNRVPDGETPKLRLVDVCYTYGKSTPFEKIGVSHINLDFHRGKITGIIGQTGSGKSTLVQLLNGLEKPECGNVFLDGADIWQNPKKMQSVRFKIGLVMQYPEYQLFEDTVYKDIAYGPGNMGLSESEIDARVRNAAKFTGVDDSLFQKSPFDLSGGQKRRVAIAGIMAMNPEVLVLDEPAAGLDPQGRHLIFSGIKEYNRQTAGTVIVVSHSMEDMAEYCDDIAVLDHGAILCAGTKNEIFAQPERLLKTGLDVPQVSYLMLELKKLGVPVDTDILTYDRAIAALSSLFSPDIK